MRDHPSAMIQKLNHRSLCVLLAAGLLTACSSPGTGSEAEEAKAVAPRSFELRGLVEPGEAQREALTTTLADPLDAERARRDPQAFLDGFMAAHPSEELRWVVHRVKPTRRQGSGQQLYWDMLSDRGGEAGVCTIAVPDPRSGIAPASESEAPMVEFVAMESEPAFTAADLEPESIGMSLDQLGRPALAYAMRAGSAERFGDWSEARIQRVGAILIDGECVTAPTFMSRIAGPAIIQFGGQMLSTEIDSLVAALRTAASEAR